MTATNSKRHSAGSLYLRINKILLVEGQCEYAERIVNCVAVPCVIELKGFKGGD